MNENLSSPLDGPAIIHNNIYSTDLIKKKALGYLTEASEGKQPFFLTIAPIGPHSCMYPIFKSRPMLNLFRRAGVHSDGNADEGHLAMDIPAWAPRHADRFPNERIPRTESFNPDQPSGVSWVKHLPKAVSPP